MLQTVIKDRVVLNETKNTLDKRIMGSKILNKKIWSSRVKQYKDKIDPFLMN